MHKALMRDVDPKSAGRWREEQVWIGGGTHGPRGAMFVPPHHSRVVAAIDDLLGFAQRNDVPVLPQIALAHPQFETIHPFTDGNGRTGRALLQAMLRRKGLTRNVTVPVSAGLLTDTDFYFAALTAYREGDTAPIVRRVSKAAVGAVFNGRPGLPSIGPYTTPNSGVSGSSTTRGRSSRSGRPPSRSFAIMAMADVTATPLDLKNFRAPSRAW